jgi:hypothetical protein
VRRARRIFAEERHRAFHKLGQISPAKPLISQVYFAGNSGTVPFYPAVVFEFEEFWLLG